MVMSGKITRNASVRLIRDGIVIFDGKIGSLRRYKDDVKEVKNGYDFGLTIEKYNDEKVGDVIEAYEMVEIPR
jgi:translation initiation factor IF-2